MHAVAQKYFFTVGAKCRRCAEVFLLLAPNASVARECCSCRVPPAREKFHDTSLQSNMMCDVCNLRELYAMSFFQVSCTVTMASYSDLKGSSTVGVKRFRYAEMLFQPSYQPVGVATHLCDRRCTRGGRCFGPALCGLMRCLRLSGPLACPQGHGSLGCPLDWPRVRFVSVGEEL